MNRYLPYLMSVIILILTWTTLLNLPFLEKISPNKLTLYATISIFIAIIVFIMFASIFKYENIQRSNVEVRECFKLI